MKAIPDWGIVVVDDLNGNSNSGTTDLKAAINLMMSKYHVKSVEDCMAKATTRTVHSNSYTAPFQADS